MENLMIRKETERDYAAVENLTREAFWNVNVPGCDEHYLVHTMRRHEDFIPELAFVLERNGKIIGNVMYTRAALVDESGFCKPILTFGPLSILPAYQRRGYGRLLLEHSFRRAEELGYDVIVIFGNPDNYVARGFKSCRKYHICLEKEVYPAAMPVKELHEGALDGRQWYYRESQAYHIDEEEARRFDEQFAPKKKEFRPSQEEFYIHSHSVIR